MERPWMPIRIPLGDKSYLQDVTVYLVDTKSGGILIDSGLNTAQAYRALENGMKEADHCIGELDAILLTHYHLDHSGLALRLQQDFHIPVYIHDKDRRVLEFFKNNVNSYPEMVEQFFLSYGIPEQAVKRIKKELRPFKGLLVGPTEVEHLTEGQRFKVASSYIEAIFTPGHTPGHMSFFYAKDGVLFGGDFLLKDELPHVGLFVHTREYNTLKLYLESLERVKKLDIELILPAHGEIIKEPSRRINEVLTFLQSKIGDVLSILKKGPFSVAEICERAFGKEGDALSYFFLLTLTLAYIRYLEEEGMVVGKRGKTGIKFVAC